MNLSICLIMRNEEKNLNTFFKVFRNFSGEIVVVDTGSTDSSKEIAMQFTDLVFDFEWCNDFSAARNYSISKATNDWVLILDADETILDFDMSDIENFIDDINNERVVGRIKIVNEIEDNLGSKRNIEWISRLFNRKYFYYSGIIHEQVTPLDGKHFQTVPLDIAVNHAGYRKEILNSTNKLQRNINLLIEAININSGDPYLYYQLGKSYGLSGEYGKALESFEAALGSQLDYRLEYVEDLVESYGYALLSSNKFNDALCLEKYRQYYNNSPDFNFLLALIYMNNGQFSISAETFLKCTELEGGKTEGITTFLPLYNIGIIFECLGYREEALEFFQRCGDYEPAKKRLENL